MNEDPERLCIPKQTGEDKPDFHSQRVAYINLLCKTGSDVKTAQELARHSDSYSRSEYSFNSSILSALVTIFEKYRDITPTLTHLNLNR